MHTDWHTYTHIYSGKRKQVENTQGMARLIG